jgi:hypothetical protein
MASKPSVIGTSEERGVEAKLLRSRRLVPEEVGVFGTYHEEASQMQPRHASTHYSSKQPFISTDERY